MEKRVDIKIASKLKDLGFKGNVNAYFEDGELKIHNDVNGWNFNSSFLTCVSAPTISDALDWFTKMKPEYNALIFSDGFSWYFDLRWIDEEELTKYPFKQFPKSENERVVYETKEQAREKALEKLIEIVENEQ